MLQLTPEQLTTALSGLTLPDKAELLRLLELRDRLESDAPEDPRPPLALFVRQMDPTPLTDAERAYFDALPRQRLEALTTAQDAKAMAAFIAQFVQSEPSEPVPPAPTEAERPASKPRLPRSVEDDVAASRARDRAQHPSAAHGEGGPDKLEFFRSQRWLQNGGHPDD